MANELSLVKFILLLVCCVANVVADVPLISGAWRHGTAGPNLPLHAGGPEANQAQRLNEGPSIQIRDGWDDSSENSFDYRTYILNQTASVDNGRTFANISQLIAGDAGHNVLELSALNTFLWKWTGNESYAERSVYLLSEYLRYWEVETKNGTSSFSQAGDFFASFPLVFAYYELSLADKLHWDEGQREHFVAMVREVCRPQDVLDNNAATIRAAGTAMAVHALPELKTKEPTFWPYAEAVWNAWYSKCDTLENALTYNSIWAFGMLILADLLGHVRGVATQPCVQTVFDRFASQVPPAGSMPAYGDDGTGYPLKSIGYWTPVFERLASLRSHAPYRYFAQRLYSQGQGVPPWGGGVHEVQELFYVAFADQWQNPQLQPTVPDGRQPGEILHREHLFNISEPDKVVLTTGKTPRDGTPYILQDLYTGSVSGNEHSHTEQAGALAWYEAGSSVFLHSLGYHNRLPEHAQQVFIADSVENFPMRKKLFTPGVYQIASLPTAHLAPLGAPDNIQKDKIFMRDLVWSEVNFRVQNDLKEDIFLYLDWVSLEGADGTEIILLDDFSSKQTWGEQVTDTHTGKFAVKITCPPGSSFHTPRDHSNFTHDHYLFDSRHFTQITFWWKVSTNAVNAANNRLLIFRTPPNANYDIVVPLAPFQPSLSHSSVYYPPALFSSSQQGNELSFAYSDTTMTAMYACQATTRRQSLLTTSGVFLALDTVMIPKLASNSSTRVGGPVWHFPVPRAPTQGTIPSSGEWFGLNGFYDSKLNTRGNTTHLLVYTPALPSEEHTTVMAQNELWNRVNPYTVGQWSSLSTGSTHTFLTIFHPYLQIDATAEGLAKCIKILSYSAAYLDLQLPAPPSNKSSSSGPGDCQHKESYCIRIYSDHTAPALASNCSELL